MIQEVTQEVVEAFINGRNPQERIVAVECSYTDSQASVIYYDDEGVKRIQKDDFKPFCWAKLEACLKLFNGNRTTLQRELREYGIGVKALATTKNPGDNEQGRLDNGFKFMFFAKRRMSFARFSQFFKEAGVPIYDDKKDSKKGTKLILSLSPVEQHMIATGKRLFKGYDSYSELARFSFDIETTGIDPKKCRIEQIGIRCEKRKFEKVITVEKGATDEETKRNELLALYEFCYWIGHLQPDVLFGHNSENFDWDFEITRAEMLGDNFKNISEHYIGYPIYKKKKEAILKLGGEVETYFPTILWGHNIVDSLHAARRAQAIDSSMESANLKYVTQYLNLKKDNRVYVPGDKISLTWNKTDEKGFAFNNTDGDWYEIDEDHPIKDGYEYRSGKYIVERYLLDDIWEADKVELALNEANFLVAKMLPTTFSRACTMGTAGIWKLIMLAWAYENDLALPDFAPSRKFTGGLSRLLQTGYVDNVAKLDYNSLYPSIILTWNVGTPLDITNSMLHMLNYVLTQREKYKGLKAEAGAKASALKKTIKDDMSDEEKRKIKDEVAYWKGQKSANDKKQLPLKILGNSFFGSFGAPNLFNFGDVEAAEMTTCIGRQSLRLMIYHFSNIKKIFNIQSEDADDYNYTPIVGDTDGFNFALPKKYRYTKENPYISTGAGRNSEKGKEYVEVDADIAEFEDMYFHSAWNGGVNKMGLGLDEVVAATINLRRKNYLDLMPNGEVKKVGNTVKSRALPEYLKKFMDIACDKLLHNDGHGFIEAYYAYLDDIFNYRIPIKSIASKGNIKKSLEEYKKDCNTLTKAGSKKSRQAWYELAIRHNLKVNLADKIYFINTGTKKSESNVKRVTHKYVRINGKEEELNGKNTRIILAPICEQKGIVYKDLKTKDKKEMLKPYIVREEDEIILNCKLVPQEIVDTEDDVLCSEVDGLEYNVELYVDQFNSRIKPFMVCFSPDIRDKILVKDPSQRNFFTEDEAKLVAGMPARETDQDTYKALMTPEFKEIDFWQKVGQTPPFIKECEIDWDGLVENYKAEIERHNADEYKALDEKYLELISKITSEELDAFATEGVVPEKILAICGIDENLRFYYKDLGKEFHPSTGGSVVDDLLPENFKVDYSY